MNKGISKWPARALNILVVLAMVISLSAILVAPPIAAAQEWTPDCNPSPVYNGCHLDVAVNTYIKTGDGNFIPEDQFSPGDCFYVNAVVVNDGNASAIAPINATISWTDGQGSTGIRLGATGETYTKTWTNGNLSYTAPAGLMADFWWKVCCNAANGNNTIRVNVTSDVRCDANIEWPAYGTTVVNQSEPPENRCIEIEIVEAPGMPDKEGILGDYHMTMSGTVNPCTNFGIKAEITNNCIGVTYNEVYGIITLTGEGSLVGDNPGGTTHEWYIGSLAPGETKGVGWTVHCDDPGNVSVSVTARDSSYGSLDGITTYIDDPWTVHQTTPGGLLVEITNPVPTTDCTGTEQPIKQPSGTCGDQNFTVNATVTNTGDEAVDSVFATVGVEAPTPPAPPSTNWVQVTSASILALNTLTPGEVRPVQFTMQCKGTGIGNITVTAYSATRPDLIPGLDRVTIDQMAAIAQITPDPLYATPSEVNKCQEFDVTFRYNNYTGQGWTDPQGGNITATILWTGDSDGPGGFYGNASLIDSVYSRRIVSGQPLGWTLLTASPTVTGNDSVGYTSTVHIPIICNCCGAEVRWRFKCTEIGQVQFYSTLLVQQNGPPAFTGSDITAKVCVDQVWKAHLTGDAFFFIQDDYGKMIRQEAVVPGTVFHVVIPVINTGDAAAENVQVYFTIVDAPAGNCTKSYEVIGPSGDGSVSFNPQTGVGIATFDVVPGHSVKKAILLVRCLCEGRVTVWIPDAVTAWGNLKGIRALDANTQQAVPQANIVVPPCPRELEQVPFRVEIENPHTCDTYSVGARFPVKAKITNGSSGDMRDVYATINSPWSYAALVQSQSATKLVGNISAGASSEITWELECTGANPLTGIGDVAIQVSARSTTPLLTAWSDDDPQTPGNQFVIVHQVQPPGACLSVTILSPDEHQVGQDWDVGRKHVMVATGQQFAVTAKVENSGPNTAEGVMVDIDPSNCDSLHYVTLVDEDTDVQGPYTIDADDFVIVTWTLYGGSDHDYAMQGCDAVENRICVNATMDTDWATSCGRTNAEDNVEVSVYPAAFLVTSMDISPSTTAVLGDEFTVDYTITNYGVADATTVVATLAADNSNVHIAAGTGGWAQSLGTIPGWGWGDFNSVSGSFTLVGTAEGLTTLTLSATGQDECGWHALVGTDCESNGSFECEPQYNWVQYGLLPIQSRFLILDSETVALSATGECPDVTSVNISLNSGWNLISLPLIPDPGNGTVSVLFSGKPVDAIWSFSGGLSGVWSSPTTMADGKGYWVHMTAASTISYNGKVNPLPPNTPPTYSVVTGWNLMGFKSTCAGTAGSYLSGVPYVRIWGFADGAWRVIQSADKMQAGLGYWIAATGAGTIYP